VVGELQDRRRADLDLVAVAADLRVMRWPLAKVPLRRSRSSTTISDRPTADATRAREMPSSFTWMSACEPRPIVGPPSFEILYISPTALTGEHDDGTCAIALNREPLSLRLGAIRDLCLAVEFVSSTTPQS
jgi:hypothetical protein